MRKEIIYGDTPVIFLAMFWGGGGPYKISQIINAYDWINRAIPTRAEMETALNTLLAMGLVEKQDEKFLIPESQYQAFDAFKKKKRKNKFDLARMYFMQLPDVEGSHKSIELTEDEYKAHVRENRRAFKEALRRSK